MLAQGSKSLSRLGRTSSSIASRYISHLLPTLPLTPSSLKGISRSASVVIAYLIKNHDMSYEFAFAFVKKYRACIKPNSGFVKCLKEWEIKQRPHINRSQTEYVFFPPPHSPPATSPTDTQGSSHAALARRNASTGRSALFGLHLGSYINSVYHSYDRNRLSPLGRNIAYPVCRYTYHIFPPLVISPSPAPSGTHPSQYRHKPPPPQRGQTVHAIGTQGLYSSPLSHPEAIP